MPSITTWMRLEPRSRSADMNAGLQARIYDPLWLLARQWQVGEFQGEDNGSPASARWLGEAARLTRYSPGHFSETRTVEGQPFNGAAIPLEAQVERERIRPDTNKREKIRFAVDAGQHFLRMLDEQAVSRNYRGLFRDKCPFTPLTDQERAALDADSLSFFDLVAQRTPDGHKLYALLNASLRPPAPSQPALPADLAIAPGDKAEVRTAAESWLRWYDAFVSEPAVAENLKAPWSAERMEYGFSVAARMGAGEKVLTAQEYFSGRVDWHDFNINEGASLRAGTDAPSTTVVRTTIPAPVTYRGMPAARFWEFEDSQVDFGSMKAGASELARMLLIEFAISYGNDWFVIPIDLDVGSLCRTHSLTITNTFGERFLIRSSNEAGPPYSSWRMFQLSSMTTASAPGAGAAVAAVAAVADTNANLFFLPPALGSNLEGRPIEEVLFLRDEMANMAWGVERIIESPIERPLNRFEQQRHKAAAPETAEPDKWVYRLTTEVPENWVPLLPVKTTAGLRLVRAKILKTDGTATLVGAVGRVLNPEASGQSLQIFEEEIPREGVRVTRSYQLARWQDGSTHLWIGRRKQVGRGEGSSGLKFDSLRP